MDYSDHIGELCHGSKTIETVQWINDYLVFNLQIFRQLRRQYWYYTIRSMYSIEYVFTIQAKCKYWKTFTVSTTGIGTNGKYELVQFSI